MNKRPNLSCNQSIREAIQRIALHGVVDPSTGIVRDSAKVTGYVVKIHTDGEFAGTIDVQEFVNLSIKGNDDVKIGYHEGVFLSAIQDNSKGMVVIPKMHSEVTIVTDPETKVEYVSMFSHVDIIQLDSHEKVTIGVTEREEYDTEDENSPDIEDLEETGVHARTTFTKNSAVTDIQGENKANKTIQTINDTKFQVVTGDNKSSQIINQEKIQLQHDKATATLDDNSVTMKYGASSVVAKDGVVYLGSESGVDDAVLGAELATILMDMLDYASQIKTTTQLGPQPPLNIAQFIALKAQINAFKNSHSGFLTKKVQVQK
jgi:hypothetical protein